MDYAGKKWRLPELLEWEICHGFSSPCDSFELSFLYSEGMLETLSAAVELEAIHGGRTVFRGRVDSYEAECGEKGAFVTLRGRGMQALLLDNEAESADYYYADLDYILARHAAPLLPVKIDKRGAEGKVELFSVENGWSHWKALSSFAEFCCGVRPRFAPDGTLVINGEAGGGVFRVDPKTPVISQSWGGDRYGVISHVLVKRRYTLSAELVRNSDFADGGGRCLRIVNMPKSSRYDAMRHEGEYQIKKSMEGSSRGRITVAGLFAAFPGDTLELAASPLGLTGSFLVTATSCVCSPRGGYTEIEMSNN